MVSVISRTAVKEKHWPVLTSSSSKTDAAAVTWFMFFTKTSRPVVATQVPAFISSHALCRSLFEMFLLLSVSVCQHISKGASSGVGSTVKCKNAAFVFMFIEPFGRNVVLQRIGGNKVL